ncbi:post-GPI attachment to proteins factor 6-like [Watersipora subatra]|uniref:post-GPI attachment to proteins factor 6-like n=1 Tax=Watersipora subatra TaxID=2589382 RepID=UPI00355BD010
MSICHALSVSLFCLVSLSNCVYELQEPVELREYKSYSDVKFFHVTIPDTTSYLIWSFTLFSSTDNLNRSCDLVDATVYIQNNGLPVFSVANETFPDNFLVNSSYLTKVQLSTERIGDRGIDIFITSPSPGVWFAAGYIEPSNRRVNIRPQGFSPAPCTHHLKTSIIHNNVRQELQIPVRLGVSQTLQMEGSGAIIRYFILKHTYRYTVQVTDCKVLSAANSSCALYLHSNEIRLPSSQSTHSIECDWSANDTGCVLAVNRPTVNHWHFVSISNSNESFLLQMTLIIVSEGCGVNYLVNQSCEVDELSTDEVSSRPYTVDFVQTGPLFMKTLPIIHDDIPYHASFNVETYQHSGGTLNYRLQPVLLENSSSHHVILYSCISRNHFTNDIGEIMSCSEGSALITEDSKQSESTAFIPYPQSGIWYLSIVAECYNSSMVKEANRINCTRIIQATIILNIRPCVNNMCGRYGECYMYYQGIVHWSACRCKAGYRGYGCTDSSQALSDGMQLLETLLLTLSNVLFAVAGFWAIYRKWFSEALIYFFVFFASSFYHACDNGTVYTLCVLDYGMLQYFDFYGSILAVWVTAMALSQLSFQLRSFLHTAGVLGILIGTQVTLSGLWNFVIPLIIAVVILATSWARLCRAEKSCYPKARVWLAQLLPGAVCALVGLALYSFVETEANYYYVHSIWHLLMALAIMFLLPREESLACGYIKGWCCQLCSHHLRRNEPVDGEVAREDNQPVLVSNEVGSSGESTLSD